MPREGSSSGPLRAAATTSELPHIVCLLEPEFFGRVGHYADFHRIDDDEVIACMQAARDRAARPVTLA